jgi:hypothetical protein
MLRPYCDATMRIVTSLVDLASLRHLIAQVGLAPQPPEPLARSPHVG